MAYRILVVDDNQVSRKMLCKILGSEYVTLEAEDGTEALEILRRRNQLIHAILLDLIMPEMDGFGVLAELQRNPIFAQIPIIITTASEEKSAEIRALSLGATEFVRKPYDPDNLRCRVKNLIRLRESASIITSMQRDKLTGLYNRDAFFAVVKATVQAAPAGAYILSSCDIEHFKVVNDQYGSGKGDAVLRTVAETVQRGFSHVGGVVGRIGGDNFAILYPASFVDNPSIQRIVQKAGELDGSIPPLTFSIGRYLIDDPHLPPAAMYDRAAMAKNTVKGRFDLHVAYYSDHMRQSILDEQQIVTEMREGLRAGQFQAWYQPQYNIHTGALMGAEALVRWWRPDKGFLAPGAFIPIFERNGFIYEMDKYIWERACILLRRSLDAGVNTVPISVNISRKDVLHDDLCDVLTALVEKYHLPRELLRLEITESAFSGETRFITNTVGRLTALGFTVEIDDFGSGYSSLNTLKDVPAQIIKLDMRFLEDSDNLERGGSIIESVVRMARWLDMSVIAEGVEKPAQATYLKSIGCRYVQGFLFAKPMPEQEYAQLLARSPKEENLVPLRAVSHLDSNAFWNPESMDSLVFNSYVGAACVFEFDGTRISILRVTDAYRELLEGLGMDLSAAMRLDWSRHMPPEELEAFQKTAESSFRSQENAVLEYEFRDLPNCPARVYLRCIQRTIAVTGSRCLIYCITENITAQREAEQLQKLAESREKDASVRLSAILRNMEGGVSLTTLEDEALVLLFHNEKYYQMLGYTREQFAAELPHGLMDAIINEDKPIAIYEASLLASSGKPRQFTVRANRRDGTLRYFRINSSIYPIRRGDKPTFLSVQLDVTDEVVATGQLKEASQQLEAVMEGINCGVTATVGRGSDRRFLFANRQFFAMLGYTQEQFEKELPRGLFDALLPEDQKRLLGKDDAIWQEGTATETEVRARRRDGSHIFLQVSGSICRFDGEEEPVNLTVFTDVTSMKLNERRLSDAEQVQAIIKSVSSGIAATTLRDGRLEYIFYNDNYCTMFGYTREQFLTELPNGLQDLIPRQEERRISALVRESAEQGVSTTAEFPARRRDGKMIWVRAKGVTQYLEGVSLPVNIAVLDDITGERETNKALLAADERLRFLNETAHQLMGCQDPEEGVRSLLSKAIAYFDGARAYVFELTGGGALVSNTYEVCVPGVRPEQENLQNIPVEYGAAWFNAFALRGYLDIADVSELGEDRQLERELLTAQGIRSLVAAPIYRDESFLGFMGVDDPNRNTGHVAHLKALGDYLTVLLARRDADRK